MLSQLLLQIDAFLPGGSPLVIIVLAAGLVFVSGHCLMRLRASQPALAAPTRVKSAADSPQDRAVAALRHSPVPVLVTDAEAAVRPVAGYVISRSTEGVVIELEEEGQVDPGTQLKVRPSGADDMVPWVLVEVKRRQALKSCWQLECRYVRTPPYSVRMLFG